MRVEIILDFSDAIGISKEIIAEYLLELIDDDRLDYNIILDDGTEPTFIPVKI